MGGHLSANATAAWTLSYLVIAAVLTSLSVADRGLLHDLGLNSLPDIAKINISLTEYTSKMSLYLQARQNSIQNSVDPIPKLVTFSLEKTYSIEKEYESSLRLRFPVRKTFEEVEVENAQLRILAQPIEGATVVHAQVHQIMGARRRRFLEERVLYLSRNLTKWIDFDVTSAVQSWLNGDRNLGFELVCLDCDSNIIAKEAAVTALVQVEPKRRRRSVYQQERRTDCREGTKGKSKCCRHNMTVKFNELHFPEMKSILEPKTYEAGFCQGQCPPNYNFATNHSRIQSIVHQMDRKQAKKTNRKPIPKACCSPSKLGLLEILRVDPHDESRLIVETWENMQVIECACS